MDGRLPHDVSAREDSDRVVEVADAGQYHQQADAADRAEDPDDGRAHVAPDIDKLGYSVVQVQLVDDPAIQVRVDLLGEPDVAVFGTECPTCRMDEQRRDDTRDREDHGKGADAGHVRVAPVAKRVGRSQDDHVQDNDAHADRPIHTHVARELDRSDGTTTVVISRHVHLEPRFYFVRSQTKSTLFDTILYNYIYVNNL